MGSPGIFSGRRSKLLTPDAILKSTGAIIDYSGAIDYIPNGHAEVNTVGVVAYANTPGPIPITGTGGAPNSTLTRSTVAPLAGTGSFVFTKSGSANRQGEGFSLNFTIDSAMQAQQLAINLLNQVATGTYVAGDMAVYVYDVTNAVIIQPSAYLVQPTTLGGPAQQLTFQTAPNSVSYRLCFHVASTSALDYSLKFKNISVGPQVKSTGVPETDWISYTPLLTTSGGGAVTLNATSAVQPWGRWRRAGDSIELNVGLRNGTGGGATGTAGIVKFSFPAGITRENIIASSASDGVLGAYLGPAHTSTSTTAAGAYDVYTDGTLTVGNGSSGTVNVSTLVAGYTVSVAAKFKVTGWSSNVLVSDSASTRVVAFDASGPTSSHSNSISKMAGWAVNIDDVGAWDAANNRYTVKIPGKYKVMITGAVNNAAYGAVITLYKNGVAFRANSAFSNGGVVANPTVNATLNLVVGDYLEGFFFATAGTTALTQSAFTVDLIQGPAQIAASEVIAARYSTSVGQSLPTGVYTVIDFATRTDDTHGAVTTGSGWKFTAPAPGFYTVRAINRTNSTSWTTGQALEMGLYKNASIFSILSAFNVQTAFTQPLHISGEDTVWLNTGEYIDVRIFQNTGSSITLQSATAAYNYVTIKRLGGVG